MWISMGLRNRIKVEKRARESEREREWEPERLRPLSDESTTNTRRNYFRDQERFSAGLAVLPL